MVKCQPLNPIKSPFVLVNIPFNFHYITGFVRYILTPFNFHQHHHLCWWIPWNILIPKYSWSYLSHMAYDLSTPPKTPRNVWRNARPTRASSAASGAPQRRRPQVIGSKNLEIPYEIPIYWRLSWTLKTSYGEKIWWFEWDLNGEHWKMVISTGWKWWFSQTVIPKQIELDQIRSKNNDKLNNVLSFWNYFLRI